ncbi:hypothetical protein KCP78_21965 [Salmonella enterica subsp. enterica]|nr:hypothetical protein KCP78_21965 [Salmonella enterica subsp. enterica]
MCLFYGARKGGIASAGLLRYRFGHSGVCFPSPASKPPADVLLVIAVVAASATLQASGGLDVMLQIAESCCVATPNTSLLCRSSPVPRRFCV